jgi:glycoside/pentoside/hexuronide:cation symporter, GPH family
MASAAGLTRRTMMGLSAPAVAMSALTLPLTAFLPEYYANSIGMELAMVGAIFMAVRLFDIGVDPFLGGLMDRTRTRWGRYKPWLVIGAPVVMAGVAMLFLARPGVGPLYLLVSLFVVYMGYSIVSLAQLALTSTQTHDYDERSRVFSWWQLANTAGLLSALSLPSLLSAVVKVDRTIVVHSMAVFVLILTPLTVAITCLRVRDASASVPAAKSALRDYFALFELKSVRALLLTDLIYGLAIGILSVLGVMFMISAKQMTLPQYSLQLVVLFGASFLSTPFWPKVKMEKHKILALSGAIYTVSLLINWVTPPGATLVLIFSVVFAGFGYSAMTMMPRAMLADIADERRLSEGVDRTALLYALLTGIYKIGQALAIGFVALDLIHYIPAKGSANSIATLNGVMLMYAGVPAAMMLIGSTIILFFPLTAARAAKIRAALALHEPHTGQNLQGC